MTAKEGRKKSVRVLVVVGNGRGAAGDWGGTLFTVLAVQTEDTCGLGLALCRPWVHAAGQISSADVGSQMC